MNKRFRGAWRSSRGGTTGIGFGSAKRLLEHGAIDSELSINITGVILTLQHARCAA
jgi:hypothetical protein